MSTREPPPGTQGKALPRRGPTDEELAAALRFIARALLEVERGHRPASMMRRFLAPHLAFDLENASRPTNAPAVAARDVGGSQFQRVGRRRGFGVVVVRDLDRSWVALMFVLQRNDAAAWRVVEISRLRRGVTATHGALAQGGMHAAR